MRKDELAAISGPNEFAEFYNRLKQIKEFHRKHPNEVGKLPRACAPERTTCGDFKISSDIVVVMRFWQISIPMSAEFEELMKARDNPSEEAQSGS